MRAIYEASEGVFGGICHACGRIAIGGGGGVDDGIRRVIEREDDEMVVVDARIVPWGQAPP